MLNIGRESLAARQPAGTYHQLVRARPGDRSEQSGFAPADVGEVSRLQRHRGDLNCAQQFCEVCLCSSIYLFERQSGPIHTYTKLQTGLQRYKRVADTKVRLASWEALSQAVELLSRLSLCLLLP